MPRKKQVAVCGVSDFFAFFLLGTEGEGERTADYEEGGEGLVAPGHDCGFGVGGFGWGNCGIGPVDKLWGLGTADYAFVGGCMHMLLFRRYFWLSAGSVTMCER